MKSSVFKGVVALACVGIASAVFGAKSPVKEKESLFPLQAIRLTGGPLYKQQELNRKYLRMIEPDRLLSWFRKEAGLDPKAPPYRGWESETCLLPGHILGFYLSGASMTVMSTGDEELKKNLLYIVDELDVIQKKNGSGFALAFKDAKKVFAEIQRGDIRVTGQPWNGNFINGHFEPTYTLNKILLGLVQVIKATDSAKAREVFLRMSDWFGHEVMDRLDDNQLQELLWCEHGSMPESFVDAYRMTGERKYYDWSRRLCHEYMVKPLAEGNGAFLTGHHANSNIPKFTGFEHVYQITGAQRLHRSAITAWDEIVNNRSWVIGGNSSGEYFFDPVRFLKELRGTGPESCNSVNMLRLTEALFVTDPSARRMDFYERVLFNHILATHDNERAMTDYFTPLFAGAYRVYGDPFDSFWCCTGTGLEVPGKYGQMVYTRSPDNSTLSVQLFASSTLDWKEKGVKIVQTTDFPFSDTVKVVVETEKPVSFTLRVRKPAWCAKPSANVDFDIDDGYIIVSREWNNGDSLVVTMPKKLRVERLPGNDPEAKNYVAFVYGPIVLAGEAGRVGGLTKESFWSFHDHMCGNIMPENQFPCIVAEKDVDLPSMLEPVPGKPLTFRSKGFWPNDMTLSPYYDIHFQRYVVYWHVYTPEQHKAIEEEKARKAAEKADIDARTIDFVKINDRESEKAHELKGERTNSGWGAWGRFPDRGWRDSPGGWFSYRLKLGDKPGRKAVRTTYWGREAGARAFTVWADGVKIASESLHDTGKEDFISKEIVLPEEVTRGKTSVEIKFVAGEGQCAGGLFGLRTLEAK